MIDRLGPRLGIVLGLIALCAASVSRVSRPPRPVPATASATVFSAERAMRHVEAIAVRPHAMGMPDHDRVRDYIVTQLAALGLKAQIQTTTAVGTRYQSAGRVQNILAWMPGSNSNGKALLLAAHYDGVPAAPAASDDAAGCAALLETLRALRARKQPLANDVIALFTDGEEAGLLGAAAFVREHPWAKDVAFVLNFEARGTSGRSYMFETGPGNLDAVSTLRSARDVTAGSMFTTVYRALPNDTDLSEFAVLGLPALNFAFADGVERYHTSHDDVAHLNAGSLQHHGAQMLALAERIGGEPLPRPKTGDGVFFDFPVLGLVLYPVSLAVPLAIFALVLTVIVVRREWRAAAVGSAAVLVSVVLSALLGSIVRLHGPAEWSGIYASAVALAVIALNVAAYLLAARWTPRPHPGALIVWLLLAVASSILTPGVSYLFTWPLLFALVAARSQNIVAEWIAAAVTLTMLAGLGFAVGAIMLGVSGTGAVALAVVTSLVTWLLLPLVQRAMWTTRWPAVIACVAGAGVLVIVGLVTVRHSADHPTPTSLVYAENASTGEGWLGSFGIRDAWTRAALGGDAVGRAPAWTAMVRGTGGPMTGRSVQRVGLGAPTATLLRDTLIDGARRVVFRVNVPAGTTSLMMHASGAPVVRTAIDARVVDTTRFRRRSRDWVMQYWAVPDSGAVISLAIPVGGHLDVDLAASRPGLPALSGVQIPSRPPSVVPVQSGDVSVAYARVSF